jgi:hypothetical protein
MESFMREERLDPSTSLDMKKFAKASWAREDRGVV